MSHVHSAAYLISFVFFFHDSPATQIYPLSLHDALPISALQAELQRGACPGLHLLHPRRRHLRADRRSEEHTSELQSHSDLVCRLLLEKKKLCLIFKLAPSVCLIAFPILPSCLDSCVI